MNSEPFLADFEKNSPIRVSLSELSFRAESQNPDGIHLILHFLSFRAEPRNPYGTDARSSVGGRFGVGESLQDP
jgi:hypothetical protein